MGQRPFREMVYLKTSQGKLLREGNPFGMGKHSLGRRGQGLGTVLKETEDVRMGGGQWGQDQENAGGQGMAPWAGRAGRGSTKSCAARGPLGGYVLV